MTTNHPNDRTPMYLVRANSSERIVGQDGKPIIVLGATAAIDLAATKSRILGFDIEPISILDWNKTFKHAERDASFLTPHPDALLVRAFRTHLAQHPTATPSDLGAWWLDRLTAPPESVPSDASRPPSDRLTIREAT